MKHLRPQSEAELAEMIAGAAGPLRIEGGGTRPIGRPVAGTPLSTAAMSGIVDYEPGSLTLVAKAGTPVEEIEGALAAEGQRLAFEPMDHRGLLGTSGTPTIGGVVAGNVSGPRRIQVGACRDFLLGVRFVDGTGRILKNGGRVMKNVTGYDLVKLMAGSRGTLGVISEVSFKVLPEAPTRAVLLFYGLSDEDAVKLMTMALGSPFEVSGASHSPVGLHGEPTTILRIEGFAESVTYRAKQLAALLAWAGEARIETDDRRTAEGWKFARDVRPFQGAEGDVWRFSVMPGHAPALVNALRADWPVEVLYDWGGGLIWVLAPAGMNIRPHGMKGHATLIRASEQTRATIPVFHPEPAPIAAITKGLRAKFDPRGILNHGLMDTV